MKTLGAANRGKRHNRMQYQGSVHSVRVKKSGEV